MISGSPNGAGSVGIVAASAELLENDALRLEKARAARARALEFSWEVVARRTVDLYESLFH